MKNYIDFVYLVIGNEPRILKVDDTFLDFKIVKFQKIYSDDNYTLVMSAIKDKEMTKFEFNQNNVFCIHYGNLPE